MSKISDERLAEEVAALWPEDKKAIFRAVTGETLNDGHYINAYDLTDKIYTALRSGGEEKDGVGVKPLEWHGRDPDYTKADCILGRVEIINTFHDAGFMVQCAGSKSTIYRPNIAEAKAAAQADYERRILSALTNTEPYLRAENERLRKDLNGALRANEVLSLTIDEAVKVLEPIVEVIKASEAHARLNGNDPDRVSDTHEVTPYKDVPNITLGHLRAIKSFLSNLKGAE